MPILRCETNYFRASFIQKQTDSVTVTVVMDQIPSEDTEKHPDSSCAQSDEQGCESTSDHQQTVSENNETAVGNICEMASLIGWVVGTGYTGIHQTTNTSPSQATAHEYIRPL